ncbi:phage tail terminator-like protein [Methylobacterium longum]|uniref:Phage tail terminator-like protein n=1 Tax=Methylobacterium longum TaxID=767694 RepID=A0ABT8APH8_9HYPH|nr:phage tail terminator-like protein [Methylobacterium longum]MDN3571809.1 phage tail terminator-like protein [Methylobacterium longum]GJE14010.1 hypothetical protein FOHLNKBM_5079 [Methylobacterium longum]
MPSYAGAKQAIEARLRANWTTTTVAVPNPTTEQTALVKTRDAEGETIPWVYLEIADAGSAQIGVGRPGDQLWVYDGLINVHVFVPDGSGTADAEAYADQIGDIFRAARFYADTPGFEVRCGSPRVSDAGSGSDDGLWYRVTATIPFEYFHRG